MSEQTGDDKLMVGLRTGIKVGLFALFLNGTGQYPP